jgi:transcriptional regulator with XRE-family HTH domain
MREARGWSQLEVGEKAGGMKQSAIARLEDPRYSSMTLSTLKRLAKAFDVAVTVRFAPFSEFISWTAQLNEAHLSPPSFSEEQHNLTMEMLGRLSGVKDAINTDANRFLSFLESDIDTQAGGSLFDASKADESYKEKEGELAVA